MALVIKYSIEFKSDAGVQYKIDIIEDGGTGTLTGMQVADPGFTMQMEGDESDKFSPILGTKVTIPVIIADSTMEAFIDAIFAAQEQIYYVIIYKYDTVTTTYSAIFRGQILQDLITKEDQYYPYVVNLTATDGIGRLKEIEYSNDGVGYTGLTRGTNLAIKILTKLGLAGLYDTNAIFLSSCIHWYEEQSYITDPTEVRTKDPLYLTYIPEKAFIELDDNGVEKFMNCYTVLEQLLVCFGARLYSGELGYQIAQVNEYAKDESTSSYFRTYKKSGLLKGYATIHLLANGTYNNTRMSGGIYNFLPTLHKVATTYAYKESQYTGLPSFIQKTPLSAWASFDDYELINGGSGESLHLEGFIRYKYNNGGTPPQPFKYRFRIRLEIDTYELSGEGAVMSFVAATAYYYVSSPFFSSNGTHDCGINLITPPIPASGMLRFQILLDDVYDVNGNTYAPPGTYTEQASQLQLFFYDENGNLGEGNKVAIALNTTDGSTLVASRYTYETIILNIGDTPFLFSRGGLKTDVDGGGEAFAESWKINATGTAYSIEKVRALEILATQKQPRNLFDVSYFKQFVDYPYSMMGEGFVQDGKSYMPMIVTFNANMDEYSGTYAEMDYDITNIATDEDFVTVNYTREQNQSDFNKSINDAKESIKLTHITTAIAAGAVTSIDIAATGKRIINKGDYLRVVNYVGQSQEFDLDADVSESDTSMTVSFTASYDFPIGSIIQFSQKRQMAAIKDTRRELIQITSDANMVSTDNVVEINASSGAVTYTLLNPENVVNKMIWIQCIDDSNNCIVDCASVINGTTSIELKRYESFLLYSDGNEWKILSHGWKFGNLEDGSYSEFEADGTYKMNGDATVYDDLRVAASSVTRLGNTDPGWALFKDDGGDTPSVGVYALAFDKTRNEEVAFTVQLPHGYMEGSDIYPHVHWSPDGTDTGTVRWGLEYTWININGTFGNTTIIYAEDAGDGTDRKHQLAEFDRITGKGKNISSMLVCRLFRNGSHANDTFDADAFLLEIGFHFEMDTIGSRTSSAK